MKQIDGFSVVEGAAVMFVFGLIFWAGYVIGPQIRAPKYIPVEISVVTEAEKCHKEGGILEFKDLERPTSRGQTFVMNCEVHKSIDYSNLKK